MHHSTGPFHRKMKEIIAATKQGIEVWLLNSVWQENDQKIGSFLKDVGVVSVREVDSRDDLIRRHGIQPSVFPDVSLLADVDETAEYRDLQGRVCMTDFYSKEFLSFVRITDGDMVRNTYIDMKRLEWSSLVRTLRSSSLLITGRHHAVMAACIARVPFVAVEGNSHKVTGFLRTAKVNIPVCRTPSEIPAIQAWARENQSAFDDLFAWVRELPQWSPKASLV